MCVQWDTMAAPCAWLLLLFIASAVLVPLEQGGNTPPAPCPEQLWEGGAEGCKHHYLCFAY